MATYFSAELVLKYLVRTRALIIEIKLLLIKEKSNYFNNKFFKKINLGILVYFLQNKPIIGV